MYLPGLEQLLQVLLKLNPEFSQLSVEVIGTIPIKGPTVVAYPETYLCQLVLEVQGAF